MCRVYEDQLNESRSRVEELQRQLTDVSTQKARAVTETGTANTPTHTCTCCAGYDNKNYNSKKIKKNLLLK